MNRLAIKRRGVFLIEVMAVIIASVLVLGMATALMAVLLRLEREQRASMMAAAALDQLAVDLRDDVRAAVSAEIGEEGRRIELPRTDGLLVVYRADAGNVAREELRDGSVTRRETYRAGRGAAAAWSVGPLAGSEPRQLVVLEVRRPGGGQRRIERLARIEAVLGFDLRYAVSEGATP